MPEAMDVRRMAGDIDDLLRVPVVVDMAAFDVFCRQLIKAATAYHVGID
jgi:hypothetical protein